MYTSSKASPASKPATLQPLPVDILSKHEFNARADKSTPWFRIVPVVKYLRIDNDAWRLMLTNFLRAELSYPSCGDHPGTFDCSQTCHRCGGPYRHSRHQAVVHAFIRSCTRFGISSSEQLSVALGVAPQDKRPDIIVHRNLDNEGPLVLDVSVPHQSVSHNYNATLSAWNAKQNKYKDWRSDVVDFAPLIISTFTHVHPKSLDSIAKLRKVSNGSGFVTDCISRMKVALVNFEPYRRKALHVRENAGTLASDPCTEVPE